MLCKKPIFGIHKCGQCTPCRINVRRIWSSRLMLEASLYSDTGFLTLTYRPECAPKTSDGLYNLNYLHLRDFWKLFRTRLDRFNKERDLPKQKIRYYAVGEYGHDGSGFIDASGEQWNPHFHAALYNWSCAGKIQRPEDYPLCHCERCSFLRVCWPHGNATVDELNDTTASYIAGYVLKKMTTRDDLRLSGRFPEGSRMSKGIARDVVPDLADAMRSEYGHLSMQFGDVPTSLSRGTSRIPLGRYLRRKLREELDLYEVDPETGEVKYGVPQEALSAYKALESPEVFSLQEAIKDGFSKGEKIGHLYDDLDKARSRAASKRGQRILNLEAKHNIQQSKGSKKL